MEGITEIDKTKYIDECKEIVRNEIQRNYLMKCLQL